MARDVATRLVKGSYIQYSDERGSVLLINFRRVLRSHRAPPKYVLRSVIGMVRASSRFHHGPECHSKKTGCRVVILSSKGVGVVHCPRHVSSAKARCSMPYQSGYRREPSLREALVIFFMVFCMVFVSNLLNSVSNLSIRITLCLCFSLSGSARLRQLTSKARRLYPSCHLLIVLI